MKEKIRGNKEEIRGLEEIRPRKDERNELRYNWCE